MLDIVWIVSAGAITERIFNISYIRKGKYRPATTTTTTPAATVSRSGYPPWILKRGGLESSGRIPSSLYWKTKRIAFFFFFRRTKKKKFKKKKKLKKK